VTGADDRKGLGYARRLLAYQPDISDTGNLRPPPIRGVRRSAFSFRQSDTRAVAKRNSQTARGNRPDLVNPVIAQVLDGVPEWN
jgi:hypothetical protein